jgi:hypothetical protein
VNLLKTVTTFKCQVRNPRPNLYLLEWRYFCIYINVHLLIVQKRREKYVNNFKLFRGKFSSSCCSSSDQEVRPVNALFQPYDQFFNGHPGLRLRGDRYPRIVMVSNVFHPASMICSYCANLF